MTGVLLANIVLYWPRTTTARTPTTLMQKPISPSTLRPRPRFRFAPSIPRPSPALGDSIQLGETPWMPVAPDRQLHGRGGRGPLSGPLPGDSGARPRLALGAVRSGIDSPGAHPPRNALYPVERHIPSGWFLSGGDALAPASLPRQRIWVDDFAIASRPVSHGDYVTFLNDLVKRGADDQARARVPRLTEPGQRSQTTPIYHWNSQRWKCPSGPSVSC